MEQPNRSKPFISSSECLLSQHYITTFQLRAVYRLPTAKPYFFRHSSSFLSVSFQNLRSEMRKVLSEHCADWLGAASEGSGLPSRVLFVRSVWAAAVNRRAVCDDRRAGLMQIALLRDGWVDDIEWRWVAYEKIDSKQNKIFFFV